MITIHKMFPITLLILHSISTGEQLVKAQLHHDRRQNEERASALLANQNPGPKVDYLVPIVADGDTGHGGLSAVMKLVKLFVEVSGYFCCILISLINLVVLQKVQHIHVTLTTLFFRHRLEPQACTLKIKSQAPRNADTWAEKY
jgi:hypothetical protein